MAKKLKSKQIRARPVNAWAVVSIKNPRIKALEIYQSNDLKLSSNEVLIKVQITQHGN
jgi:hypothetical protein